MRTEIEKFNDKLNSLHDSLPEGQHRSSTRLIAKAFVHSIPEDERDDVQGNCVAVHVCKPYINPQPNRAILVTIPTGAKLGGTLKSYNTQYMGYWSSR